MSKIFKNPIKFIVDPLDILPFGDAFGTKALSPREPFSPNIPTPPPPPAPPETAEVELGPGELSASEKRKLRRVGTQRLQIPLATTKSGLGIPTQ